MPSPAVKGSTFLTFAGGVWSATTKASRAFEDFRVQGALSLDSLVRQFNRLNDALKDATLGGRTLPFGGPCVIYEDVHFVNGTPLTLATLLKTTRVRVLGLARVGGAADWLLNVDGSEITFTPTATFTLDVVLMVFP